MTNELQTRKSLAELEESTPEGQREMAAARGMLRAVTLLNKAVEQNNISHKMLAEALSVTEGRVSQVLRGDGNIRLSTLARYLRAAGYALIIDAEPADASVSPLRRRIPRRRSPQDDRSDVYVQAIEHDGQPFFKTIAMPAGAPFNAPVINEPIHVGQAQNGSLRVFTDSFNRELSK